MQETGIVAGFDGDFALVKVIRIKSNGCGCGVTNCRRESLLRAKNLCGAEEGDRVHVESSYDRSVFRRTMRSALCVPAFIAGAIAGEFVPPLFGLDTGRLFSAALGAVLALCVFVLIGRIYRKKPLGEAAAYEIVSPYR
jgi:hypothetical protein